jgi:hypothetical protein
VENLSVTAIRTLPTVMSLSAFIGVKTGGRLVIMALGEIVYMLGDTFVEMTSMGAGYYTNNTYV